MGDLRPRYLPPQPASKPASLNNHLNFKHANRNASNRKGLRQERVFASSLIINFMKPNKYVQSHHQSTGLFLSYLLHPGRPGQSQKKGLEDQGGVKGLPGASWSPLAFPWVPLVLPGSLPNIEKYEKLQYSQPRNIDLHLALGEKCDMVSRRWPCSAPGGLPGSIVSQNLAGGYPCLADARFG